MYTIGIQQRVFICTVLFALSKLLQVLIFSFHVPVTPVHAGCEKHVALNLAALWTIVALNLAPSLFCGTGCSAVARWSGVLICVDFYPQTVAVSVWRCDWLVWVVQPDLSHTGTVCSRQSVYLQSSAIKSYRVFSLVSSLGNETRCGIIERKSERICDVKFKRCTYCAITVLYCLNHLTFLKERKRLKVVKL